MPHPYHSSRFFIRTIFGEQYRSFSTSLGYRHAVSMKNAFNWCHIKDIQYSIIQAVEHFNVPTIIQHTAEDVCCLRSTEHRDSAQRSVHCATVSCYCLARGPRSLAAPKIYYRSEKSRPKKDKQVVTVADSGEQQCP